MLLIVGDLHESPDDEKSTPVLVVPLYVRGVFPMRDRVDTLRKGLWLSWTKVLGDCVHESSVESRDRRLLSAVDPIPILPSV